MKKFVVVAAILAVGAGVAFASSLNVPWFLDRDTSTGLGNLTKEKTYVGIHNNLSETMTCSIKYYGRDGNLLQDWNTFNIAANATVSFRPHILDPSTEPAPAQLVPKCPDPFGSAVIAWQGAPTDVQGRLLEISAAKCYAYLLPPGA